MSILHKKPITLNLLINNSNISLIGIDSLGPNKAAKAARISGRLL
jgi:hypothetical protein